MTKANSAPLTGVRIIESSLLGPAAITTHLADMGADVIKVESPSGDYVREMTWPIIEGVSLLHLHINRGKKSLVLDLRKAEAVQIFLELATVSDVVIEAMRSGSLAKRGLGFEQLKAVNPKERKVGDVRTPLQLIEAIEAKGREVDDALARLRALMVG